MREWISDPIRRRGYHVGNVRTGLLDRAKLILREQGLSALNQRAVAAAAGVSIGTVYYHFKSKSALLTEIAIDGFLELKQRIRQGAAGRRDDPVRRCATDLFAFAKDRPDLYAMMFSPELLKCERVRAARDEAFNEIKEIVKRARAGKVLSDRDLELTAVGVFVCAQGAITVDAIDEADDTLDRVLDGLIHLLGPYVGEEIRSPWSPARVAASIAADLAVA